MRKELYAAVLSAAVIWLISCGKNAPGLISSGKSMTDKFGLAELPEAGSFVLTIISPSVLEIAYYANEFPIKQDGIWNFIDSKGNLNLPDKNAFSITVGREPYSIKRMGFKRHLRYASQKAKEIILGNYLYIELSRYITPETEVIVRNQEGNILPNNGLTALMTDERYSPAIHTNQLGYWNQGWKKAYIGYYLGSLGEMEVGDDQEFTVVDINTGEEKFRSKPRFTQEQGWRQDIPAYSMVYEADFSQFSQPGCYQIEIAGWGRSFPFTISEGFPAAYARSLALGLYHRRCGTGNDLPYTRFTHKPCHLDSAEIPDYSYEEVNDLLQQFTGDAKNDSKHTARIVSCIDSCLYPYNQYGKIELSGGHHDTGDYSRYTICSAEMIHLLLFSAEMFPGVRDLDNLGLPESGNIIPDALDLVKREADFLTKMQDKDGGFYFMLYPKAGKPKSGVLPDADDIQVVYPKTTAATAAATAALAQTGSSPLFREYYPLPAEEYLTKALKGWYFLLEALDKYGWRGSYQKVTDCGDEFQHDDELIWAATEIFLAFNDQYAHNLVLENFSPEDRATMRWKWRKLAHAYGCAIRSYAFAEQAGRIGCRTLNEDHLRKCREQILQRGDELAQWAAGNAYGISFPFQDKRSMNAQWFFPEDAAFDLTTAYQLETKPEYEEALFSNIDYSLGANPLNVCCLTGTGYFRQYVIADQYAENDWRKLPPSGLLTGCLQEGNPVAGHKNDELRLISFPAADKQAGAYPLYDRWSDTGNFNSELTLVIQAKALSAAAYLMAESALKEQKYKFLTGKIIDKGKKNFAITSDRRDLNWENAFIIWEAEGCLPVSGGQVRWDKGLSFLFRGELEAEVLFPDGRRMFLRKD